MRCNVKIRIILAFVCLISIDVVSAQEIKPLQDTLQSITVVADTIKSRPAGLVKIDARSTRRMVTALGDGDVIKRMNYN